MSTINALLNQRTKKSPLSSKMAALAQQSASGGLSSFTGVFSVSELSTQEKERIEEILKRHSEENQDIANDLQELVTITSEVKAINNQAAILHGERIKKAHAILTHYKDGAFTNWLIAAYGNRQTPYNFMQYYEFYEATPKPLRPQLESMPRQAVYTLATRDGSFERKQQIVKNYHGQTKVELLHQIRQTFPIDQKDGRKQKTVFGIIHSLKRLKMQLEESQVEFNPYQKKEIKKLLQEMHDLVTHS